MSSRQGSEEESSSVERLGKPSKRWILLDVFVFLLCLLFAFLFYLGIVFLDCGAFSVEDLLDGWSSRHVFPQRC